MSTQSTITINDGQGSPAAHSFLPRGANTALATYLETAGGIGIGIPSITIGTVRRGKGSDSTFRVEARITVPVLATINGSDGGYTPIPKVAFNLFAKVEIVAPDQCSLQNRKDIFAFVKNLMGLADGSNPVRQALVDFDIPS
jgi:hypothetical protein